MVEFYTGDKMNELELQISTWLNLRSIKLLTISKENKGNTKVLEIKRELKAWCEQELMSGWFMGILD